MAMVNFIKEIFEKYLYQPITSDMLHLIKSDITDETLKHYPDIKDNIHIEYEHITLHGDYQFRDVEAIYLIPFLFDVKYNVPYEVYLGFTYVGTVMFGTMEINGGEVKFHYSFGGDMLREHWYRWKGVLNDSNNYILKPDIVKRGEYGAE